MPYWIDSTLLTTPAFLWVYIVLGVPLALAALPRADLRDVPLVLMTGFALGSGALTVLMFILGSFGAPLLTRGNVLAGLIAINILTLIFLFFLSRKKEAKKAIFSQSEIADSNKRAAFWSLFLEKGVGYGAAPREKNPLTVGEGLLLAMIVVAVAIRWVVVAYWPFTAYDALWVYGYEGRLYFLEGFIPDYIGYYPQYLPLQFTFGQLIAGEINDSAARAVIPLLHIGSILAAYTLGARNFNRRTGIFLAGLWALYPAVGEWSRMGDLEIPLTFLITGTATFFFMAWHGERPRHYAALAGVLYGLALWTKPTAGAFALGVILLNAIELVRVRFSWSDYRLRFVVSLVTALACAPLGGAWYLRNIAVGHSPVDFPPVYWHSLAERGGGQMLWYVLAVTVLLAFIYLAQQEKPQTALTVGGYALLLVGILPSATARFWSVPLESPLLFLFPSLDGLPRLGWFEGVCILVGGGMLGWALWRYWRARHGLAPTDGVVTKTAWMVAATIPYFIVFWWLYSYHYRLAFAIVPLMALPTAVILAHWFPGAAVRGWRVPQRAAFTTVIFLLALPGMLLPLRDKFLGWDYLWSGELDSDVAKRTSGNDALMWMVDGFQIYERENGETPVVSAPGVQRLPFFFPTADIDIDTAPTRLNQLDGVTYFVDSHPDGTGAYEQTGVPLQNNQVLSALGRNDILRRAWWRDDGIFRYEIYELNPAERFVPKAPLAALDDEVIFGDFARFIGHEVSSSTFQIGQRRTVKLYWQVLDEADRDYITYIHLRDRDDNLQQAWDGPVARTEDGRYYTTLVWEPGEYIVDERLLQLTNFDAPVDDGYSIVIGLYDLVSGERVRVTRNDEDIGDGFRLPEEITVIEPAPDGDGSDG
ncbi:MAG: glycosyltransferase family 39 protein [Chloroflexota bacterium]